MGFLAMATSHNKSYAIHDFYEIWEEIIRVLRNCPMYEPDNRLEGIPRKVPAYYRGQPVEAGR
ncbi:uncharacterized protein G2W53_022124 [Senna tora]|uniref:Uncharacterized protein n=1 Tax=Senna tora TaxID=362788 RepID=A0A834TLD9_9FABA|nr:uncharacterized protein G2W53_022124 [Senna tora]